MLGHGALMLRARRSHPLVAEEPDGAVHRRLDAKLLRIHAALFVDERVPMKAGRDALRFRRARQQVARELLGEDEPVGRVVVDDQDARRQLRCTIKGRRRGQDDLDSVGGLAG